MCSFPTVDNSAGVKAAILLAPVGSYARALREVAHGGRLHINDLHTEKRRDAATLLRGLSDASRRGGLRLTHSLLQQLFQAVDVWSVPSLALHHHTVSAGGAGAQKGRV